ncbi:MAG: Asp23/Gls24 family envelope stress response protein [Streptococcaceae bacterium]|jgi:uncharacterized alkaline shock family protein YloU|nr:Asp23/Gls24 family envelope stress response protein [Streptococcaceae bacterium]
MTELENLGEIVIAPEVLETIVGIAVTQIEGVHHLHSTRAINNVRKPESRGVTVTTDDEGKVVVDIRVFLTYGARVPQVAQEIQSDVKEKVFRQTDVTIDEINIHVLGIVGASEKKPEFDDLFKEGFFDAD